MANDFININITEIENNIAEFDLNNGNGLNIWPNESEPGQHCLFIGLGGTGVHTLMRLKRLVSQKYSDYSKKFTFLGVDTTDTVRELYPSKDYMDLASDEKLVVSVDSVAHFFSNRTSKPPYVKEFLNDNTSHTGEEAGKKRQVGRALLFANVADVNKSLNNALSKLFSHGATQGQIYIFTGLGGGTGSGIFLDMAFLLRHKLVTNQYTAKLFGFLVLPDVHATIGSLKNDNSIWACAFAALKEVDYWMCSVERGDFFRCEYSPSLKVDFEGVDNRRPFDCVFPVMASTSGIPQIPDAYTTVIKIISEIVCGFASYDDGNDFFSNLLSNLDDSVQNVKQHYLDASALADHEPYPYSFVNIAVGASVLRMPFNELATYLLGKVTDKITTRENADEIIRNKVASVCNDVKITVEVAKNTIDTKIMQNIKKPKIDSNPGDDDDKPYVKVIELYDDYHKNVISIIGEITEKIKYDTIIALMGSEKDNSIGELQKIFSNIKGSEGPDFLRRFLSDESFGLLQQIKKQQGDVAKLAEECKQNSLSLEYRYKYEKGATQSAVRWLQSAYFDSFEKAVETYYRNKTNKVIYEKLAVLYNSLHSELTTHYQAVGQYSAKIIDSVKNALANNNNYFKTIPEDKYRFFHDLYSAKEIADLVDNELHSLYSGRMEQRLLECTEFLLTSLYKKIYDIFSSSAGSSAWSGFTITSKLFDINDFFKTVLAGIEDRRVNLADMFYESTNDALTRKTFGFYIQKKAKENAISPRDYLRNKIEEISGYSQAVFREIVNASESEFLIYPKENTPLGVRGEAATDDAVENIAKTINATMKPTVESGIAKDAMIYIQMKLAVPYFNSVSMSDDSTVSKYKNAPAGVIPSLHLVSISDFTSRRYLSEYYDWRNLSSFIPKNRMNTADKAALSSIENNLFNLFDQYMENKLIRFDGSTNKIYYNFFEIQNFDANNEYSQRRIRPAQIALEGLRNKIFNTDQPITEVSASPDNIAKYYEKLKQLHDLIISPAKIDSNVLREEYAERLYCGDVRSFSCKNLFKLDEYMLVEGKANFVRSLNLQRDLKWMSDFFDDVNQEISSIEAIQKRMESVKEVMNFFVKGTLCGFFGYNTKAQISYVESGTASFVPVQTAFDGKEVCRATDSLILSKIFSVLCDWDTEYPPIETRYNYLCDEGLFKKDAVTFLRGLLKKHTDSPDSGNSFDRLLAEVFEKTVNDNVRIIANMFTDI